MTEAEMVAGQRAFDHAFIARMANEWADEEKASEYPMSSVKVLEKFADWVRQDAKNLPGTAPLDSALDILPRLDGKRFSDVNYARCVSPDGFGHALESWSIAEWTNAAAGEMGEACNLAKKLLRHRDGVAGNKKPEDQDVESLKRRCAEELADVVIYVDLAMRALGFDMETTVREVFNRKSRELGAPYLVDPNP